MSMFGIVSIAIANVLVLWRVVILWEHRPVSSTAILQTPRMKCKLTLWQLVMKLMTFGFLSGFIAQLVTMILANISLRRECLLKLFFSGSV